MIRKGGIPARVSRRFASSVCLVGSGVEPRGGDNPIISPARLQSAALHRGRYNPQGRRTSRERETRPWPPTPVRQGTTTGAYLRNRSLLRAVIFTFARHSGECRNPERMRGERRRRDDPVADGLRAVPPSGVVSDVGDAYMRPSWPQNAQIISLPDRECSCRTRRDGFKKGREEVYTGVRGCVNE